MSFAVFDVGDATPQQSTRFIWDHQDQDDEGDGELSLAERANRHCHLLYQFIQSPTSAPCATNPAQDRGGEERQEQANPNSGELHRSYEPLRRRLVRR